MDIFSYRGAKNVFHWLCLPIFFVVLCLFPSEVFSQGHLLEADPRLSGRLSGPEKVDAKFGEPHWQGLHGFQPNDFLLGSVSRERDIETSVLFAFRVSEGFEKSFRANRKAALIFSFVRKHEGDASLILPIEVFRFQNNLASAHEAANSEPLDLVGRIVSKPITLHQFYRFDLVNLSDVKKGDVVWIGLNARNFSDIKSHNLLLSGDLISLPGSVPPMLIAGSESEIKQIIDGQAYLKNLHNRLDAPANPGVAMRSGRLPYPNWYEFPLAEIKKQRLASIKKTLEAELVRLPSENRVLNQRARGFRSDRQPIGSSWKIRMPIDRIATAICLKPAVSVENNKIVPYAFPRRFRIVVKNRHEPKTIVVADWSDADFPCTTPSPVVFSILYNSTRDSIEMEVLKGEEDGGEHFYALEEIYLYEPTNKKAVTKVEFLQGGSLEEPGVWSRQFLTDGRTTLKAPEGIDPTMAEQLPWIINLLRGSIIKKELKSIDRRIKQWGELRDLGLKWSGIGIGVFAVLALVLFVFVHKRKALIENRRIRHRIQQDLHDEIGSGLGTISLITDHLMGVKDHNEFAEEIADANLCAREAITSLREVIWLTDKEILTLAQCVEHIRGRAEMIVRGPRLEISTPDRIPKVSISRSAKRNLFLLFAEAITNGQRHGQPKNMAITISLKDDFFELTVDDDGKGFDIDSITKGIGLPSMKKRALSLNGDLDFESSRDEGTRVIFRTELKNLIEKNGNIKR